MREYVIISSRETAEHDSGMPLGQQQNELYLTYRGEVALQDFAMLLNQSKIAKIMDPMDSVLFKKPLSTNLANHPDQVLAKLSQRKYRNSARQSYLLRNSL